MEFKLRDMSQNFKKHGCHVGAEKNAKRMLICAALLKRLSDDDYWRMRKDFKQENVIREYDKEYLFKLMNKYMFGWWD
jgi:viroplasmin and RNaseH domain-containing protein